MCYYITEKSFGTEGISRWEKLKHHTACYVRATTLHGFAYVGETERNWKEKYVYCFLTAIPHHLEYDKIQTFCTFRFFWMVFITGGFVLAGIVFTPLYNKWMYTPIIRSIETTNYPIEKIDFPAVTICSNNKVNNVKLYKIHSNTYILLSYLFFRLWNLN